MVKSKKSKGTKSSGMSLTLFLDSLSINSPCSLQLKYLLLSGMQDRCQTQLCGRNKLEYAHRQFSTFRERQKSSSHPFENASFVFQQKSDIVTPWGSSQLVNSGPFSPIFIADPWCLSLLANCSAPRWERFLFISNSTTHSYWPVKPARPIEGSNRLFAHGSILWRWL